MQKYNFSMRQNILVCFSRLTVPIIAVHLQNANDKFHKVMERHYSSKVENVYILYGKFTQDNTHQILLGSPGFRLRCDKNILVFFSVHSVHHTDKSDNWRT